MLHSAFPHADNDAEHFVLGGNFTSEATTINNVEVGISLPPYVTGRVVLGHKMEAMLGHVQPISNTDLFDIHSLAKHLKLK